MAQDRLFYFLRHFIPYKILALLMASPYEEAGNAYKVLEDLNLKQVFPCKRHRTWRPQGDRDFSSDATISNRSDVGMPIYFYDGLLSKYHLLPVNSIHAIFARDARVERLDLFKRQMGLLEHEYLILTVIFSGVSGAGVHRAYFRIEREKEHNVPVTHDSGLGWKRTSHRAKSAFRSSSKASLATSTLKAYNPGYDTVSWVPYAPGNDDSRNHWYSDRPRSDWCMGLEFPTEPCNQPNCRGAGSTLSAVGCVHCLYFMAIIDIAYFVSENYERYTLPGHADNCYRYSLRVFYLAYRSINNATRISNHPAPITGRRGTLYQLFTSESLSDREMESLYLRYKEHKKLRGQHL